MKSPGREEETKACSSKSHPGTFIAAYPPKVLSYLEFLCEQRPTFRGDDCRETFSGFLDKTAIAAKFGLRPTTAWRVARAAWQVWADWYQCEEAPRHKQVLRLAEITGWAGRGGPSPEHVYRDLRRRLRLCQEADVNRIPNRFQGSHAEFLRQVIEIAKASIESCPWRNRQNKPGGVIHKVRSGLNGRICLCQNRCTWGRGEREGRCTL